MQDDIDLDRYDSLEDALEACLDADSDTETCYACGGEGCYHDCGEDTCCCLYPEDDDMYECEECRGTGRI
jgi:hypothetical protein